MSFSKLAKHSLESVLLPIEVRLEKQSKVREHVCYRLSVDCFLHCTLSVSYTYLDVYKRQK